jgi:hypothetical protein
MVSIRIFSFSVITSFVRVQHFCVGLMKGFPMVRNDLLVTITYGINLIASMNSRNDNNTFQWLCNTKGPLPQRSWKQGMVERLGVL